MNVSIIILAAGSSSRMGKSKQLLQVDGEALLLRGVKIASEVMNTNIIVVLGANEQAHRKLLENTQTSIVINSDWQNGMGSSIKAGLSFVRQHFPNSDAVIIMVCDQPNLTTQHLNNLIERYLENKCPIVGSYYSQTVGVPALFDRSVFDQLLQVEDSKGAKSILQKTRLIESVNFPGGEIDLDTPDDYMDFIKQ